VKARARVESSAGPKQQGEQCGPGNYEVSLESFGLAFQPGLQNSSHLESFFFI
jgi:hypothetical protein